MLKKISFVSAIALMFAFAMTPVLAMDLDLNMVANDNSAFVMNEVGAVANTGGNFAGGSEGGEGGNGGDIENGRSHHGGPNSQDAVIEDGGGDSRVVRSTTGNGGAGGNGGLGGLVVTGNADAAAGADNTVNYNQTDIQACPCDEGSIEGECSVDANLVRNRNLAMLMNGAGAAANTGENVADGSEGGEGGNGGDIENGGGVVKRSDTGNGARGGDGSDGGEIRTGNSLSRAGAVNVVNMNITRIYRGVVQPD